MTEREPDDPVVELGVEAVREPEPLPRPTSRLHSAAVAFTAICGVIALLSTLAFVTVRWPGAPRRVMIAILLFAVVGFITGVS
ncbi:MAG: hypothetical protein M3161_02160, partial [Actinomycetota bacterium]|nr:hypothetical protein [Actinomycetota bacterium]